jgi:multicomponent Na+:H+ antiporter subunit G
MDLFISISSGICLLIGSFICLSGAIGMLRFPDFYTRMHAASVTDTSGVALILVALMINSPDFLVLAKLVMILLLGLLIGPTTGHVLAKAAYRNGVKPQLSESSNERGGDTLNY